MTTAQTGSGTPKHILVVDDDVDIRATLSDYLEDEGYSVAGAANGREALEYLRAHPSTSVILLDLMMPVMDGFRFRSEQKNDPKVASIPVVVMTARGAVDPRTLDVQDVIAKPLNLTKLMEAIARAARRPPSSSNGEGPPRIATSVPESFLAGGGEMGGLIRSMDWSRTAIGPMGAWPQSLKTALSVCLGSKFPMFVWWGRDLTIFYNDAYAPILGTLKHPRFLGRSAKEQWAEVWDTLRPMTEQVIQEGTATWFEDFHLFPVIRQGFPEDTYFTFSYSPVRDESGEVGGVFCAVQETTKRVLGERRIRTLRELGQKATDPRTVEEASTLTAMVLSTNAADVPFALIYLVEEGTPQRLLLKATAGAALEGRRLPEHIALAGDPSVLSRSAAQALQERKPIVLEAPLETLGEFARSPWPEPLRRAVILPITSAEKDHAAAGILMVGVNPRLPFDEDYRGYLDLLAGQLATAIATARTREEEKERTEALAEIDRAKTAFFSNVSHEFRTPLTLMLGPLEDQLDGVRGPLPPALREDAQLVHRNAVRLLKLVNTLLDFSRIEAGRIQAVYEPTDLSRLTADLASVFRSATEKAGLKLKVDCPSLPEPVYVDREMWEKIVLNLISNAFKFTFEGEVAVSLRWAGDAVELEVRDTGTGIPAEELPHIFQRFHRVEGARARTQEGSGIGLALVQELVNLHRGAVRAESRVGEGTRFIVSIPTGSEHLPKDRLEGRRTLAPTSVDSSAFVEEALKWLPGERDPESMPAPAAWAGPEAPREARILLADDNADMREYIRRLLSQHWNVEAVSNGAAALAFARENPLDLVLTDVMMPELDGFGLLRELRSDPRLRAIPVIMLSARAGEEARVEGFEAGADDYLVKPFSARELMARVASQLALARLRREIEKERDARLEELSRTVRVSEMFVGILSHDLRNPLSAISTAASVLVRRSEESEKALKPALRILSSADRMRRMIDQLLDFTRARLGSGITLQRSQTDLADICRLVMDELEGGDEGAAIQLQTEGNTLGEWDRDRLAQLLSNLLANALGHGAPGSPVSVRLKGKAPNVVCIEVHNQGVIPAELMPVLFEPFRTGEKKLSRSSGLGLGLFITKQITLAHAGSIRVESSEAAGTCFIVELPRMEAGAVKRGALLG
ncbi:ATP-binding protein [Myxococcus qinghaiensis]|uniref:ATP-binding protein n=1 Tax=Myxococcus qinghaiensis TaxID=2906758 RepID=UPI0020A6F916|nr:ATP-binding protein [Myxococcus qinghaiensis]MCP3167834.1 response regulator [Myxococcus qinghaiensis]